MIPTANNSNTLLHLVSEKGLYTHLINQIKKDFELSGLSISLESEIRTEELVSLLFKEIRQLIQNNFDGYLQLLYRVDVSEITMQTNTAQSLDDFAKKATLLILKREWEKVYYREMYS